MQRNIFHFLIFLFVSCDGGKNDSHNKNKMLSASVFESLAIPVPTSFNPDVTRVHYYESDSGEYMAILNKIGPAIEIYNLKTKNLSKRIKLQKDGPNKVGLDNGFVIKSNDTIILASIPPKIMILNFQGEIIRRIPIKESLGNEVNFLCSNNYIPFLFQDDFLFGAQPYFQNIFEMNQRDLQEMKHFYKIDLKDSIPITQWLDTFRPTDSWKKGKKDGDFSWADRYDSILISPNYGHKSWLISKKTSHLIGYFDLRSTEIKDFYTVKKYSPVGDEGIIEDLEKGMYEILLFDSYRDVFYRFFFRPIDPSLFPEFTTRQLFADRPQMGVLIIDSSLKILGEYHFPKLGIDPWNYFVGRKGLYVSTNNPSRDDFDENVLRYDIIRFEGLNYEE